MSDRLDRVLRVIDSGLQSSGETGHTFDAGGCARCQQVMPATDDGDLCPRCKAFLLGDGPEPMPERPTIASCGTAPGSFVPPMWLIRAFETWRDALGRTSPATAGAGDVPTQSPSVHTGCPQTCYPAR